MKTHVRPDVQVVERAWSERGFSFGVWTDPPGQIWENYLHDTDELFMILEGEMELEIEGEILRPEPGAEILIPARTRHTVRNTGSVARWLYGYKR